MQTLPRDVNPFALMLDPQAVLAQIEHSERLERLQRRICRPLDKPVLGAVADDSAEDGSEMIDNAGGTVIAASDDALAPQAGARAD